MSFRPDGSSLFTSHPEFSALIQAIGVVPKPTSPAPIRSYKNLCTFLDENVPPSLPSPMVADERDAKEWSDYLSTLLCLTLRHIESVTQDLSRHYSHDWSPSFELGQLYDASHNLIDAVRHSNDVVE